MSKISKSDFYYGALLSVMLSNKYVKPALFEENDNRRIYTFSTDKGDYMIYMKYLATSRMSRNDNNHLWNFVFSSDEINYIKSLNDNGKKHLFGFICGKESFSDSEIAILTLDETKSCLGMSLDSDTNRISVKAEKNRHGLMVYGTGRADRKNGMDNTIKVARNILENI